MIKHTLGLLIPLLLSACQPAPISSCDGVAELQAICGFRNPEDLALLPDDRYLLVSEMGDTEGLRAGAISLFDTSSKLRSAPRITRGKADWGDPACQYSLDGGLWPHGIHLARRPDQEWQLLAINHAPEQVEFFALMQDDSGWSLDWRGCVTIPEPYILNDLVASPDGGFFATHMYDRNGLTLAGVNLAALPGLFGFDTGMVVNWDGKWFNEVAGSEGAYPNGLQLASDGQSLFVNYWLGNELRHLDWRAGKQLDSLHIGHPDNSQWDADGRLLIAGHDAGFLAVSSCFGITEGACAIGFTVYRLDVEQMRLESVLQHVGPPMGAATVAQQVGDALYLGSFAGDRLLRAPYP